MDGKQAAAALVAGYGIQPALRHHEHYHQREAGGLAQQSQVTTPSS